MTPMIVRTIARADPRDISQLGSAGVATVHEAQGRNGLLRPYMRPIYAAARVAGSAVTVLCAPGDNLMIHAALAVVQAGDVLVVATSSESTDGMFGELMAQSCLAHGVLGWSSTPACATRPSSLPSASPSGPGGLGTRHLEDERRQCQRPYRLRRRFSLAWGRHRWRCRWRRRRAARLGHSRRCRRRSAARERRPHAGAAESRRTGVGHLRPARRPRTTRRRLARLVALALHSGPDFTAASASRRKSVSISSTDSCAFPLSHQIRSPKKLPARNWTSASDGTGADLSRAAIAFTSSRTRSRSS